MTGLHGYTLMLACTKCGLKKRIDRFPTQAAFMLGDILTSEHIDIYKKGCLRCGTCRFEVLTAPEPPPPPDPPRGWTRRTP
jgi:ferredoxin